MGYTPQYTLFLNLTHTHTHNKTCHTVRTSKKMNVKTNLIKRKILLLVSDMFTCNNILLITHTS